MSDTSNPLAIPADWSWRIGQRFLDGARSCGYACERAFVIDPGVELRLCCDPCQLGVQFVEGLQHPDDDACCYQTRGEGMLFVDLCKTLPDDDGDWVPAIVNGKTQANSLARGAILQGIQKMLGDEYNGDFQAWLVDPVRLSCRNVDIGQWTIVEEDGPCVRWGLPITVNL